MRGPTRREFLSTSTAGFAVPQVSAPVRAQAAGRPKNILFLLSDQHKPGALGLLGDPHARTANLDALAQSGLRFEQAYCANPVCTPSRASLLTGLYTHNHRTWNNAVPWPFEIKTLAHHFSRAGYISALIGKMHFVDAQTHGFDYRLDFNDWFQYLGPKSKLYAEELSRANSGSGQPQIDDLWRDFGDPWIGVRELDDRQGSVHMGRASKIPERDHFESFVARETVRFLKRFGKQHPFFLISSYLKPHDPFMPPEGFARMFSASSVQLPGTYGKVDLNKVPREIRNRIELDRGNPEIKDPDLAGQRIAMYYGNVAHLDHCLGQVLEALRALDLEKDTVVLYSSDHGEMLGEHGLWHKFVFYEPSVGVPLIFRVPGLTQGGAVCRTPVSQVSLFATLLELCGLSVPSGLDGDSLLPLLRDPGRRTDAPVYAEFALRTPNARYMIRRGEWKYSFYVNDMPELYNLRQDPLEMNNLALEPEHRTRAEELKADILAWYRPPELMG
ncbi:MAG: sulfatase-like hydrolase/transferase [Acidobacteria bacterium]|nr:sulfatase-like hydrolase/transferase [Acidobacteriota bacterium]